MSQTHAIDTLAKLEALFGQPAEAASRKEIPYLHPAYQALIPLREQAADVVLLSYAT